MNLDALFICGSPFQLLMAREIIRTKNITSYGIVCLYYGNKSKYDYYYYQLKKNSSFSSQFEPMYGARNYLLVADISKFKKKLGLAKIKYIDIIYFASINSEYIQMILSSVHFSHIHTFDDGVANIDYSGMYHRDSTLSWYKELFWKIYRGRWNQERVKANISNHYTIYPNKKNISKNLTNINLFKIEKPKVEEKIREGYINVFVGQPLNEVNVVFDNEYINNMLEYLNIEYYFPHPREAYLIVSSVQTIDTEMIFEDYIFNLYTNSKYQKINIYSFFSSVLLNIEEYHFANLFLIKSKNVPSSIYEIFEGSSNISYIEYK